MSNSPGLGSGNRRTKLAARIANTNKITFAVLLATLLLFASAATFASAASTDTSPREYAQTMSHNPPNALGCFKSTYPSTVWQQMPCDDPSQAVPATVGNGYDYAADGGTNHLEYTQGDFNTASGITSEYDSLNPCYSSQGNGRCSAYYTLQINSNTFSCTPAGESSSGTCWEQFIFANSGTSSGAIEIQYWLKGWYTAHSNTCPSQPANSWLIDGADCWMAQAVKNTNAEDPTTKLASLTFYGESNYGGNGYDTVQLCDGGGCWSNTYSDTEFHLYNGWSISEFNIFGYGTSSDACLNVSAGTCPASPSGTPSLKPEIFEYNTSGVLITPACYGPSSGGTTAETNNLNIVLYSCTQVGSPLNHIYFTEHQ